MNLTAPVEMENVVIFVPTEREAEYFAAHGLQAYTCGVGMAECAAVVARVALERFAGSRPPELFVLAGVAGVYGDALSVGDTVVVEAETVADLGRREADGSFKPMFQKNYPATFIPELLPSGVAVARGVTVSMAGGLGTACPLPPLPSVVAVENMEGAAFFAVCEGLGIRAMEVRTVSNRVGEAVTAQNLDMAARGLAATLKTIVILSL